MACKHEAIKCVDCVKFCLKCGAKLPADFVPGKSSPEPAQAAETPEKGRETARKRTGRKPAK